MKLCEMKRLPRKAGLARLQFGIRNAQRNPPYRDKDLIVLPDEPKAEFCPLQNGRQFLLRSWPVTRNWPITRIWFGGTDENPFLVELENDVFEVFKKRGQKGFYEALKPKVITAIEKRFNVASQRQGDIWAVPIPSWDDANFVMLLCFGETLKPRTVKSKSIFGTRHRLTGRWVNPDIVYLRWPICGYVYDNPIIFAEGTVEGPGHSPMELKGVHVLAQTRHLVNPIAAD